MRSIVLLAISVTGTSLSAEPREESQHAEIVVRLGVGWMKTQSNVRPVPQGRGPAVDAELAWRLPHVSFAVFGAFFTVRDAVSWSDQCFYGASDARYYDFDFGGRITLHNARDVGPLVGFGVADESVVETGRKLYGQCNDNRCSSRSVYYADRPYTQWNNAPFIEAHVGAELPKLGGVAVQLMALVGLSANPDDHGGSLFAERLLIGARF